MGKADLMREIAEQNKLETKAAAYDKLIIITNNAIGYMLSDAGMEEDEVADYIGTSVEMLRAIDDEDVDAIAKL